ncbi:class I SAM-dependent methyltransferase [Streptomyces mordarskii]|uniref:class I SAM-dependent methyltransferase n=1 Tax=Streptomyces mordarskii TaxID=1226758 RepID=UPI0031F9FFB8
MGCGTGGEGLWLARTLALRLTGIDISTTAAVLAAERRAHFILADAPTQPDPPPGRWSLATSRNPLGGHRSPRSPLF